LINCFLLSELELLGEKNVSTYVNNHAINFKDVITRMLLTFKAHRGNHEQNIFLFKNHSRVLAFSNP